MRVLMLLAMFLLFGLFFIVSNDNLHLNNSDHRAQLGESYYNWIGGIFDHGAEITSYVIKSGWIPGEDSQNEVISR